MDSRTRSDQTMNVDARKQLAAWLRAGRDRRNLTIEDVAKVTKIQPRILEKLESGSFDGLPAEVFVKGFVRSYAKCVGLDESEALVKYTAAQAQPAIAVAKALVDTISGPVKVPVVEAAEVAPVIAAPVAPAAVVDAPVESAPSTVEPARAASESREGKRKRSRRQSKQRNRKRKQAQLAAAEAMAMVNAAPAIDTTVIEAAALAERAIDAAPVAKSDAESFEATAIEAKTNDAIDLVPPATEDGAVEMSLLAEGSDRITGAVAAVDVEQVDGAAQPSAGETNDAIDASACVETDASVSVETDARVSVQADANVGSDASESTMSSGTWRPTMPPAATTPSLPWRRPNLPASATYVVPTLVIDDADPDSADREREDRIAKEPHRLSFLPPILLDREDRSSRQGGLTLAVIILLIAATLTLSYLMRRPSPSGDGVTRLDNQARPSMLVG